MAVVGVKVSILQGRKLLPRGGLQISEKEDIQVISDKRVGSL